MSVRRRLFGRSHDSMSNSSRASRDGPPSSPLAATHAGSQLGTLDKLKGKERAKSMERREAKDKAKEEKEKEKEKEKEGSVNSSGTVGSRHKVKRSVDKGERLSIFGATFGGSLGKTRKPPPSDDGLTAVHSNSSALPGISESKSHSGGMFALGRFGTHSSGRKVSGRSTAHSEERTSEEKERSRGSGELQRKQSAELRGSSKRMSSHSGEGRATLRKRTTSGPAPSTSPSNGGGATYLHQANPQGNGNGAAKGVEGQSGEGEEQATGVKQGLSILEQVGEPDHVGWMRKKGVRYNSWKNRYCVLKGEHLYILRSAEKKVRFFPWLCMMDVCSLTWYNRKRA